MSQQRLVGQGFLIIEVLQSHSNTQHSVGLLCTSDQPKAETITWQHTKLPGKAIHFAGGIRKRNPSQRAAEHPRLRPRGQWDVPKYNNEY